MAVSTVFAICGVLLLSSAFLAQNVRQRAESMQVPLVGSGSGRIASSH